MSTDSPLLQSENDEDTLLFCQDCEGEFVFIVGNIVYSQLQGLNNVPKRCPSCEDAFLKT